MQVWTTLERLPKSHLARLFSERTTFFKSFSIMDAFAVKNKTNGFTLAEVLITLGIIGVVAAMTLPVLTAKYQKIVTQTKLKKFYTIMHQAIKLAELEHGDYPGWAPSADMAESSEKFEEWYNKYLDKHIASINKKALTTKYYQVGLKDGSGFVAHMSSSTTTASIDIFYCTELKYCGVEKYDGKVTFLFYISPRAKGYFQTYGQGASRERLLENCKYGNFDNSNVSTAGRRHTCAALIQYDGWEIKDDYPWNQIMIEN